MTKDELIAKGHGTRHYQCGHTTSCRCGHNTIHIKIEEFCPDCVENKVFTCRYQISPEMEARIAEKYSVGRLNGKNLNQAELLNYFLTGKLPEDNSLQERILANTSAKKKNYQEWMKQRDNTI
jgi:hypothetical protein